MILLIPDVLVPDLREAGAGWTEILERTKVRPHAQNLFDLPAKASAGGATHARLNIYPDGGVSRLRLFGTLSGSLRR